MRLSSLVASCRGPRCRAGLSGESSLENYANKRDCAEFCFAISARQDKSLSKNRRPFREDAFSPEAASRNPPNAAMPTLFRLLTILAIIAGIIYGIMAALVYFVEPTRSELTIEVPLPPLTPVEPEPESEPAPPAPDEAAEATGGAEAAAESAR
ncbi:hypothetical protein FP2506_10441 [Fulvimarina pelagi HTCC2506]|uniref:Uncharacterized protein n=2 Tax=Fulvimarina pelagi TaxID=217511 RepID=Q0G508_9HYPH|nr:hypothetical protein FP2506_10441 [Fulvimarina pelagi HTCC2506]